MCVAQWLPTERPGTQDVTRQSHNHVFAFSVVRQPEDEWEKICLKTFKNSYLSLSLIQPG